jgi:hypothetical protein
MFPGEKNPMSNSSALATMSVPSPVVEAEFTIQNTAYPFVGASEKEDCVFELAKLIPRPETECTEFFNVVGTEPERIQAITSSQEIVDVTLLREYEHGGLFEFLVSDGCPAYRLAEPGALPHTVRGIDGEGRGTPSLTQVGPVSQRCVRTARRRQTTVRSSPGGLYHPLAAMTSSYPTEPRLMTPCDRAAIL